MASSWGERMMQSAVAADNRGSDASARRRKAFIDAARSAFFSQGYAGTVMSSIASQVGGSKTTLWSYFASKEELFSAVVDDIVDRYGEALLIELPPDEEMIVVMRRYAVVLMKTLLSQPILALFRLVAGEAERFPHLAAQFYAKGPRPGKARLAAYLDQKMEHGMMRRGDPAVAAKQFVALCQAGVYQQAVLGLAGGANMAQLEEDIDAALDCFRRTWMIDPS